MESEIIGTGVVDAVLKGKKYKRPMRVHKKTVEALWCMILPELLKFREDSNSNLDL